MIENPAFAIEFAKMSLLTNVGRINTTMACESNFTAAIHTIHAHDVALVFPEMKTALRSYHPVPSLQKTDGNLQDAPRIKNCLKAALLPTEFKSTPPTSPAEVLEKLVSSESISFASCVFDSLYICSESWPGPSYQRGQLDFHFVQCKSRPGGHLDSYHLSIFFK